MTSVFRSLICFAATAALAGCQPRRIPGTEIDDTRDSRAILIVMEQYRAAIEARDSAAVVGLVADDFKDDGGTATTEDDLDSKTLGPKLGDRLARVSDVKLDLNVKKILFNEDRTANAIYNYSASFRMPGLSSKVESVSEIKQMTFKLVGDEWKIKSGI
ncbi:MAG: DUF4440 domain-containing protein [Myxococcaceae bacterium]